MKRLCTAFAGAIVFSGVIAPQAAATSTVDVVALGDSSASGAGAGDYKEGTGTPGGCWRSRNAYAEVLVAKLKTAGKPASLTNVTCSGAATTDLGRPFRGQQPQLDSLKTSTDLVTLTIGGNDIGLGEYAGQCLQSDCTGAPFDAVLQRVPALTRNFTMLVKEIKHRSPRATIVVTGYGRQVSPGPTAAGALDPICGEGVISAAERKDGARIAKVLDTTLLLNSVVAGFQGTKTAYVSQFASPGELRPEFTGRSQCEDKAPYYRGFDALAPGQEGPEAVLHLNRAGHSVLAGLIATRLT
jgi:lysophospholipase L1-like esterase